MKILDTISVIEELCKAKKCYGIYFELGYWTDSFSFEDWLDELRKAIPIMFHKYEPYLIKEEYVQAIADECGYILLEGPEAKSTMEFNFDQIIGDDGPTRLNNYDGPLNVYAITFGPDGPLSENT